MNWFDWVAVAALVSTAVLTWLLQLWLLPYLVWWQALVLVAVASVIAGYQIGLWRSEKRRDYNKTAR